ncbi:hypothetical protein BVX94_00730, partial [bacterium B17]
LDTAWIAKKERELLERADVVFAASRFLERKLKEVERVQTVKKVKKDISEPESAHGSESVLNPESCITDHDARVFYMPHGVEHAKFARALKKDFAQSRPCTSAEARCRVDAVRGEKIATSFPLSDLSASAREISSPVVGFYGNIHPWIDFNLLEELVKKKSEWNFQMIGQVYCDVSRFDKYDNIQFIGRREHDDLPNYCRSFHVAIIPYDIDNPRMKSVNPVKTKELLSSGVPVVGVDIEELRNFGDDVLTPGRLTTRRTSHRKDGEDEKKNNSLPTDEHRYTQIKEELVNGWIESMENQISRTDRKEISERMKDYDWPIVVKRIRDIVEKKDSTTDHATVVEQSTLRGT